MENPEVKYGICLQGYIPIRKDPHERSEMVSQVLFGESVEILDDEGKWIYIKCLHDNYQGWIDKKCIESAEKPEISKYLVIERCYSVFNVNDNHRVFLPSGSSLPEIEENRFRLAGYTFELETPMGLVSPGSISPVEVANQVVSVPYLWGGRCGYGFDCSGLTQFLCRLAGIDIPRDSSEQSAIGETLSFMNEAKGGDLAFFDDTEGMIHHVGMLLDSHNILHSSGNVRIDKIDQQGIFDAKLGRYTHKLRVVKRVGATR